MPNTPDKPRIWGYARISRGKDGRVARTAAQGTDDTSGEPSIERQAAGIKAKAIELADKHDCVWAGLFDDVVSGADVGFDERAGYQKLVRVLDRGDHLVVWQLSRIDRNPFRLYRACEFLVNRRVHIHSFGDTGGELDLSTAMGRATLAIMAVVNDLFIENLRASTKDALQWRKANGLAYGRHTGLGKRRQWSRNGTILVRRPDRDDKTVVRTNVWDQKECDLIREVKKRHDAGESFYEIGLDFEARGEKSWDGSPWVTYGRKRKKRADVNRVRRCYIAYEKLLDEGGELGL